MIAYIRYRWKLRQYLQELNALDATYDPKIKKLSGGADREALVSEKLREEICIKDQILRLTTDFLWAKANKLIVPVPQGEEFWEDSHINSGDSHLNEEGVSELRRRIRSEHHDKTKVALVWLSAGTGLIGAATGFIAVLLR